MLASVEHPRIDEQIAILKRNPGYLNLLSHRSRPFLHYLVEQIDRRGLSAALAL
ncbi:MAG TPA: lytic transglycosylase, partial [Candidatus Competibacteraceae bacterium]|nr:lytic transglycosylase [Candidatus Competibacteraceae bacterium]